VHIISTVPVTPATPVSAGVTGESRQVAVSVPTLEAAAPTDDGNALSSPAAQQQVM